jgi:aminopeptidase N
MTTSTPTKPSVFMPTTPSPTNPDASIRENLTRQEAQQRAAQLGEIVTRVHLDLTTGAEQFGSTSEISFVVRTAGPSFLDCTAVEVHEVTVDGTPLDPADATATRIPLPELQPGPHTLRVAATMAYRHEGSGLHRFVDPSDDRVYLHSQFEPFDAHLVYACFDQPDLKTVFELVVDAPEEWVVVSNAPAIDRPGSDAAGRWSFAPTPRVSTYVTAVVAGPYASLHDRYVRDDGTGIDLGLYARRSLAEYLDPDELFEVTRQSFTAFESLFHQHYPFGDSYDQLFVPEFSAGAMENPGCVTFTETYLFRSKVTDAIRERRAETIIHEMAHMWFGDLVTMQWWDDLWLNESFATFMSVLVQASATRWDNAWTTFLDAEKAWAKFQDQLPSTHPVADEMPDVESVHQNFDGITYAKGASVLRQLVAWVGQDEFLAGCRDYFARHAWGNTTLSDFLGALERASGRDLAAWRDEWLLTTGVNRLSIDLQVDDAGFYTSAAIEQTAPVPAWATLPGLDAGSPTLRRHRVAVGLYRRTDEGLVRDERFELDVDGARTELPQLLGLPAAEVVLVNDDDLTYAKTTLDAASTEIVAAQLSDLVDPLARAQVWSSTWDMVRDAELPAGRFVDLVRVNVAAEDQIGSLQRLLMRASGAAERYAATERRERLLADLARSAREQLAVTEPGSDHQLGWVRHWASVARAEETQLADVRHLLDGDLSIEGVVVDTDLRWHLVVCLARAGAIDDTMIDAELERDPTDLGERQAATARAAQPTTTAKQAAWRRLVEDRELSHTMSRQLWTGFAQLDQTEVLAPFTDRYFEALEDVWSTRSLDWAIGFSSAMFPHAATSPELLDRVDRALADDQLRRPLRRVLLEQRDTLVRTLEARAVDQADAVSSATPPGPAAR